MSKNRTGIFFIICFVFLCLVPQHIGSASETSDRFSEKFDALAPRENSSVQSDYLFEQISLGSKYTILMLEEINGQQAEYNGKMDTLIEKFDVLIEQNKKIIQLLEKNTPKDQ